MTRPMGCRAQMGCPRDIDAFDSRLRRHQFFPVYLVLHPFFPLVSTSQLKTPRRVFACVGSCGSALVCCCFWLGSFECDAVFLLTLAISRRRRRRQRRTSALLMEATTSFFLYVTLPTALFPFRLFLLLFLSEHALKGGRMKKPRFLPIFHGSEIKLRLGGGVGAGGRRRETELSQQVLVPALGRG